MIGVLCNKRAGTSFTVATRLAEKLGGALLTAEERPDLSSHAVVVFVVANTGDEELQQPMEDFLAALTVEGKMFAICELGNYFGFERDCFGCKVIARKVLVQLGWGEISDVSIDSMPTLDEKRLQVWIEELYEFLQRNRPTV